MKENEVQKESRFVKNRLPLRISVAAVSFLMLLTVFCVIMDIKPTVFYPQQENMSATVTYANGETTFFEDGAFGSINRGDKVEITIRFPQNYGIKAAELFVPIHNMILNVSLGSRGVLYRDNINMSDLAKHYGNRIYEIQLPGDFEREEMVLEITPMGRLPYTDLEGIGIIPANEGWKQIISGHTLVFMCSITLMIMATICIFYFIVKSIEAKKIQLGLSVAVFELMICGWFFGSLGLFYLIVEDIPFCAKIEYYTLYLAPIPLTMFIYQVIDKARLKKIVAVVGSIYTLYYAGATLLERMPGMTNYSKMLPGMHLLTGVTVVCMMIAIFRGTEKGRNSYIYILRFGILVAMVCGLAELLRFNLIAYIFKNSWKTTSGLSGVAILVVALSLVIYLISYSTDEFTLRIERQQLMKLAYQDALTGMPNRADCYRNIEDMEKKKILDYTMVFIDLNNLKLANDKWGHDMGDRLLTTTADAIMDVFEEDGFVSRWGGDEFVACVYGSRDHAMEKIRKFEDRMKKEDASGSFPFEVSAACGVQESTAQAYLAPIEAIRLADESMYINKRKMKGEALA